MSQAASIENWHLGRRPTTGPSVQFPVLAIRETITPLGVFPGESTSFSSRRLVGPLPGGKTGHGKKRCKALTFWGKMYVEVLFAWPAPRAHLAEDRFTTEVRHAFAGERDTEDLNLNRLSASRL